MTCYESGERLGVVWESPAVEEKVENLHRKCGLRIITARHLAKGQPCNRAMVAILGMRTIGWAGQVRYMTFDLDFGVGCCIGDCMAEPCCCISI